MTEYQEENNYPKAFLATGLVMGLLIALCYFIVFREPTPQEQGVGGILVNYGTTDEGSGNDITSTQEPSAAEKANHTIPTKVTPDQPTEQPTPTEKSNQNVVTQNSEDAPEVAANSKKPSTTVATQPVKTAPKQVVNQAALYTSHPTTGTGAGDGTTGKIGNQGSENGSTLSNNYGPGGSGNGGLNMPNWHYVSPPEVKNTRRVDGRVTIDFTIDESGNVLEAHQNKALTRADFTQIDACLEAIKKLRFTSNKQVTGNSKGQYTFIFKVD